MRLKHLVYLDLFSDFVFRGAWFFTIPTITIWMISNVDPVWYKASIIVSTLGGVIIGYLINKKRLEYLRKLFSIICVLDAVAMIFINYYFGHLPNIRFILIALNEILLTYFIQKITDDIYNNIFSKTMLTVLQSKQDGVSCAGNLIGVVTSMIFVVDINIALFISTISIVINNGASIFIRRELKQFCKSR